MRKAIAPDDPDLWSAAVELTITPRGEDSRSRTGRRRARSRRRRAWLLFGSSAASGITALIAASFWKGPVQFSGLVVFGTLSFALALMTWIGQLRARTYRRFTSRMKRGAAPTWWLFTIAAWIWLTFAGTLALASTISEESLNASPWAIKTYALVGATLSLMFSMASSASVPPLLSASSKPRHYQAHWSQITWTASAIVGILSATCALIFRGQESWVVGLVLPIGFAATAALFAWHARALHNLRLQRASLLEALVAALESLTSHSADAPMRVSSLLTLQLIALPGPFRSQSPAASPLTAGWEITEMFAVGLHLHGHGEMPEDVSTRALLEDDLSGPFRAIVDADRSTLKADFVRFLIRSIEWIR